MIEVEASTKGPLFRLGRIEATVKAAIDHGLTTIDTRMERSAKARRSGGHRLVGNARNTVTRQRTGLVLNVRSTLRQPRTKGTSWQRKNIAIIKAMAPNVLRSIGRRIAEGLGG